MCKTVVNTRLWASLMPLGTLKTVNEEQAGPWAGGRAGVRVNVVNSGFDAGRRSEG